MSEGERPGLPKTLSSQAFRIEDFIVRPALNRIERDGEVVQIEPRVMQVLVCLASRPRQVLSRQVLFDRVWADSVVCEEALTRTISELRRVFRDDTKTPRVIETIRKGGYRLIAPVRPMGDVESGEAPRPSDPAALDAAPGVAPARMAARDDPAIPAPPPPPASALASRAGAWSAVRIGAWILAAVALLWIGVRIAHRTEDGMPGLRGLAEPTPLTSAPGLELFPALSPNGSMIAFAWAGENATSGDPLDIYVMNATGGTPVRLTSLPGSEGYPAWSPDGAEIAFTSEGAGGEICSVPVVGGDVRRLLRTGSPVVGLDWSGDGRWIAYAAAEDASPVLRLRLLQLEDLSSRVLSASVPPNQGEFTPAFSPDSRAVAFLAAHGRGAQDAFIQPVDGGEVRRIDMAGRRVTGVDWLASGTLLLSASSKLDYGLWEVRLDTGRRVPLSIPGGRIQRVSCAPNGRRLAYEKISFAQSIWCVDLEPAGGLRRRAAPLIASTQRESEPVFSPDGRSIAYISDRTGTPEVWIAAADGAHPRRLTDQKATRLAHPRWSPDGAEVAYSCNLEGQGSICVTTVGTQATRRLPAGNACALGVWARTGGELYYAVETPAGMEVWRVRPDGTGAARMSPAGREIVGESPDGRGLYCVRSGEAGIWLLPFDGGTERQVVPAESCRDWQDVVAADGGFYVTTRGPMTSTLAWYDLGAQRADSLGTLEWYAASLSLSPDRSMLLYDALGKLEVDLMLAEIGD